jgi:hypothetical protein
MGNNTLLLQTLKREDLSKTLYLKNIYKYDPDPYLDLDPKRFLGRIHILIWNK